jgi:hypothetical protein
MATVSGKLMLPDSSAAKNSKVKFELVYCGGNLGRVLGAGTIVPPGPFTVAVAADGTWTTNIFGNDKIVCGTDSSGVSRWRISYVINGEELPSTDYQINSGANPFSPDSAPLCTSNSPGNINCAVVYPYTTPPPPGCACTGLNLQTQPAFWMSGDGTPWSWSTILGVVGLAASAFKTCCWLFRLPYPLTVTRISFRLNQQGSNPSFMGLAVYDINKNRLFGVDNINTYNLSPTNYSFTIAAVTLQPGLYWFAVASSESNTNAKTESGYQTAPSSYTPWNTTYAGYTVRMGVAQNNMTSGGVMPATLGTIAVQSFTNLPAICMEP